MCPLSQPSLDARCRWCGSRSVRLEGAQPVPHQGHETGNVGHGGSQGGFPALPQRRVGPRSSRLSAAGMRKPRNASVSKALCHPEFPGTVLIDRAVQHSCCRLQNSFPASRWSSLTECMLPSPGVHLAGRAEAWACSAATTVAVPTVLQPQRCPWWAQPAAHEPHAAPSPGETS